jgi:L-asparagine transporter-like permease
MIKNICNLTTSDDQWQPFVYQHVEFVLQIVNGLDHVVTNTMPNVTNKLIILVTFVLTILLNYLVNPFPRIFFGDNPFINTLDKLGIKGATRYIHYEKHDHILVSSQLIPV